MNYEIDENGIIFEGENFSFKMGQFGNSKIPVLSFQSFSPLTNVYSFGEVINKYDDEEKIRKKYKDLMEQVGERIIEKLKSLDKELTKDIEFLAKETEKLYKGKL